MLDMEHPLLEVEQTWLGRLSMSALDPKRTLLAEKRDGP
jgi:hypothetical protein